MSTSTIFGTGPLGMAVMEVLVERGQSATLVNRSGKVSESLPEGVSIIAADATNPQQVAQVCAGAEVVYMCAMPPYNQWPALFPPLMKGILEGVATTGAKLVYGDNLYMYGPNPNNGCITEDLSYAATGHKGRTRAAMAQMLLEAHKAGRLRVAIGRAPDFYGPRALNSIFGKMFFDAVLNDKSANMLGDINQPHTYTYIGDFARALVTLGEQDQALGKAWHVPSAETSTTRQLIDIFAHVLGKPINVQTANLLMLTMLGWFNPMVREIKEMYPSFANPYIVDHSNFEQAFGAHTTPHPEAVRATVDWFRQKQA